MKYVFGSWGHIFHANGPDTMVRFCFDTEQNRLVHLDIQRQSGWKKASHQEIDDVADSIKNANSEALEQPADHGLECSENLPPWAEVEPVVKGTRKQVVAVITFDDPEDNILQLADAATWIEGALGRRGGFIDVTAYTSAAHAAIVANATNEVFATITAGQNVRIGSSTIGMDGPQLCVTDPYGCDRYFGEPSEVSVNQAIQWALSLEIAPVGSHPAERVAR